MNTGPTIGSLLEHRLQFLRQSKGEQCESQGSNSI